MCRVCNKPGNICQGMTTYSLIFVKTSLHLMIRRPSLVIDTWCRYCFMPLASVTFLDGLVPCTRWACAQRKSMHSIFTCFYVEQEIKGSLQELEMTSLKMLCTGEISSWEMKVQILHPKLWHSGVLWHWKSDVGVRWATQMAKGDLVTTYCCKECHNSWTCGKLTTAEFLKWLDATFAAS